MPKRTLKQVCELHGITRDELDYARAKGVNAFDDEAMKTYLANRRPKVKPTDKIKGASDGGTDRPTETVEDIKAALAEAHDHNSVKILKDKLAAMQLAVKVEREQKQLLPLADVEEREVRIASVVKAGILKLCNDLPPMVEGLTAEKSHAVLMEQGKAILEMMADEQAEFWQDHE